MKFLVTGTRSGLPNSHIQTNSNYSLIRPAEAHLDGSDHRNPRFLSSVASKGVLSQVMLCPLQPEVKVQ